MQEVPTDSPVRGKLVSIKLSAIKLLLTSWGGLAGLSLGREGPSVQIAAGVMAAVGRFLPRKSVMGEHGLLVAGGAAGIAAAFNTPLGGVMFAIEELSRSPEKRSSGLLILGIVLAGLVSVSIQGNATYFGVIHVAYLGWDVLLPGLLAAATQAPLTSFIIVMAMVDGHAMVLGLMACALVASGISRLISRPLYGTLAQGYVARLAPG